MIDEVTILLPQQPNVVYGSGDVFTAGGKNVLITGDQGTGKSSLLEAIAISLENTTQFDQKLRMSYSPFSQFCLNSLTKQDTVTKRQGPNEIYDRVLPPLEHLENDRDNFPISQLLHNSFLLPAKPCTAAKLRKQLAAMSDEDMLVDGYMAALPRVAEEIGEELPRLYGLLHDLHNGTLLRREFPFARFKHAQLTGTLPKTVACMHVKPGRDSMEYCVIPYERITDWELVPEYQFEDGEMIKDKLGYGLFAHHSSGERRVQILEKVFARDAELIMLDEPLSGLDEGHQDTLQDRFMTDSSAQYIITSHDRKLKDALRADPGWVEWNLNSHVPSLSSVSQVGLPLPRYAYLNSRPRKVVDEDAPF